MDHRKSANGLDLISTSEIGKIIKKMDLEFRSMKMETNMKVVGVKISDMVKGLFGFVILKAS